LSAPPAPTKRGTTKRKSNPQVREGELPVVQICPISPLPANIQGGKSEYRENIERRLKNLLPRELWVQTPATFIEGSAGSGKKKRTLATKKAKDAKARSAHNIANESPRGCNVFREQKPDRSPRETSNRRVLKKKELRAKATQKELREGKKLRNNFGEVTGVRIHAVKKGPNGELHESLGVGGEHVVRQRTEKTFRDCRKKSPKESIAGQQQNGRDPTRASGSSYLDHKGDQGGQVGAPCFQKN